MQPTYEEVFSYNHLVEAAKECIKGVNWKQSVQCFKLNSFMQCATLYDQLMRHEYKSKGFHDFYIQERGKTRHIQSVHITERVVQKTLCKWALKPILIPKLIYDNGASLEGKGQDFAVKRFREHLRWHYARYGLKGGILIGDFHNFFGSIDHKILLEKLQKDIKDKDIYELTAYFINCFKGDIGLGLGSEVSQICAIYYPNEIDHLIKEKHRIHCYARYMDDFYVISDDIDKLKDILEVIKNSAAKLKLSLNSKRTQIYEFGKISNICYLKCRTRLENNGRISMRMVHENVCRRRSWLRKQRVLLDNGTIDFDYVKQSQTIWIGYAFKRKNSYVTALNNKKYFNILFAKEIMMEKEVSKDLKRIRQQLYFMEQKINKLLLLYTSLNTQKEVNYDRP